MSTRKNKNRNGQQDQSMDMRSFVKIHQKDVENDDQQSFVENSQQIPNNDLEYDHSQLIILEREKNRTVNDFMKFFQVGGIINPKYNKMEKQDFRENFGEVPNLSVDQLIDMTLLFKLSGESEFIRHLSMSEHGRKFIRQIDLCLETLQNFVQMGPESFKEILNILVNRHKQLCSQEQ